MAQTHLRPRARQTLDPYRRLLAGVVLRITRDLQLADQRLRHQAVAFFDDEGIALTAALAGLPASKIRQKVNEAIRRG